MRVLVCGGRDYHDHKRVFDVLTKLHVEAGIETIIEGGARGADALAGEWAHASLVRHESYPADWSVHGKAAGAIRNTQMLREGRPELVIAFPGGKGTKNMVMQAVQAGVKVIQIAP